MYNAIAIKMPSLEKAITIFFARFSLLNVYPPTLIPVKLSSFTTSPEVTEAWNHTKEVSWLCLVLLLCIFNLFLARFYCNKICSLCFFGCCSWATCPRIRFSQSGSHPGPLACSKVVSWNLEYSTNSWYKFFPWNALLYRSSDMF